MHARYLPHQCDQKKLPNVYKGCPKMNFTRKMKLVMVNDLTKLS